MEWVTPIVVAAITALFGFFAPLWGVLSDRSVSKRLALLVELHGKLESNPELRKSVETEIEAELQRMKRQRSRHWTTNFILWAGAFGILAAVLLFQLIGNQQTSGHWFEAVVFVLSVSISVAYVGIFLRAMRIKVPFKRDERD
ncbi:hypothetical protein [Leucobacter manosquensis]|uniref:DUF2721 domain-containing protein n=1 Tax=Leucobacter manosquensis TaxID=2810611 RepID=A0ABS5M0H4_9MICO|nr:hypothetical protein [Leucobacter manosquensis]MBS3180684.1 hypothetical protein [Leucobacter manosquensis]